MAVVPTVLIPPKQAENAQTAQYTAPTGARTRIDKFTVTNTGGVNATLSVWLVTDSGSASNANLVVNAKPVVPSETYLCPELIGQWLLTGSFIVTQASAATTLSIRASGVEYS